MVFSSCKHIPASSNDDPQWLPAEPWKYSLVCPSISISRVSRQEPSLNQSTWCLHRRPTLSYMSYHARSDASNIVDEPKLDNMTGESGKCAETNNVSPYSGRETHISADPRCWQFFRYSPATNVMSGPQGQWETSSENTGHGRERLASQGTNIKRSQHVSSQLSQYALWIPKICGTQDVSQARAAQPQIELTSKDDQSIYSVAYYASPTHAILKTRNQQDVGNE